MKKVVLLVLMLSAFCLPSKGQMFIIYDDGEIVNNTGGGMGYHAGIADTMFEFRVTYGRYPKNKKELLDYDLSVVKNDSGVLDYSIYGLRAQEMMMVTISILFPATQVHSMLQKINVQFNVSAELPKCRFMIMVVFGVGVVLAFMTRTGSVYGLFVQSRQ